MFPMIMTAASNALIALNTIITSLFIVMLLRCCVTSFGEWSQDLVVIECVTVEKKAIVIHAL